MPTWYTKTQNDTLLSAKAALPTAARNALTGWWHVDGYGAKGDGATNDSTAVNAAIAACSTAGGGVVYIPAAPYALSSAIVPQSGVTLRGHGARFTRPSVGAIISATTTGFDGFHVEGITFSGTVNEFPSLPKRSRTTSAAGASGAVYLAGDLDSTAGTPNTNQIRNFTMRHCRVENMTSLPINIRGVRGTVRVEDNTFYNNQDIGFIFNEEVIFVGNHVEMGQDNGVSLSRGNRKVTCTGNTFENIAYHGIWVAGFGTDLGPSNFAVTGNVVRTAGYNGIHLDSAPKYGTVVGNEIDLGYQRGPTDAPSDSYSAGIWVGGYPTTARNAPTALATGIVVANNQVRAAARYGVYITGAYAVTVDGNVLLDIGTQYLADGTTATASTDITTNVGIYFDTPSVSTTVALRQNLIIDTRATPYCNYGIVPQVPTAALGHIYSQNYMRGCRNSFNLQETGQSQQVNYAVQFLSGLTVRSKLLTSGTAPTIAIAAQAATVTAGSNTQNDVVGSLSITAVASPVAGTYATVTFASAHTTVPHVLVTPKDSVTAAARPYSSTVSTTGFSIAMGAAPSASAVLNIDYVVID